MKPVKIANWSEVPDRVPQMALVSNVDLVIVRWDDNPSVMHGRCQHRGAMMADGEIVGDNIICGLHGWDYCYRTGISSYNNEERLQKFTAWVEDGSLLVDEDEIRAWEDLNPQPYDRSSYQGAYQDPHGAPEEPHVGLIRGLASQDAAAVGHGPITSMGVPRDELPSWDDLHVLTAQLARRPLFDDDAVSTATVIGPNAAKPLELALPMFVSDMSFGALSREAKLALSQGAELAGTGICSGEGGMLPAEQQANSRYLYELASGRFGWALENVERVQAFHFKFGQAAKTGVGGHLPGHKVTAEIAAVRGLEPGQNAISPATFPNLTQPADFIELAGQVREASGGIPIGAKLSAQHIEADLDAALAIGVDYIILDGRGGGTGAAPAVLRNHISVPTIPALARARRHLDRCGADAAGVTLAITGGLRTPTDFLKALALGADAVAISNAALQAIGCLGMRACHTGNCPVGIATQKEDLRARLLVDEAAGRLRNFLEASAKLMVIVARACGHSSLADFTVDDLTTFDADMAMLAGVAYGGVGSPGGQMP